MRSFICLTLTTNSQKSLQEFASKQDLQKQFCEQNLHITLSFLGDKSPKDLQKISSRLQKMQLNVPKLSIEKPQIISVEQGNLLTLSFNKESCLYLKSIKTHILNILNKADIIYHKQNHFPHITLGYLKQNSYKDISNMPYITIDNLCLKTSTSVLQGGPYKTVFSVKNTS